MADSEIRATVAPGHEIVGRPHTYTGRPALMTWHYRCSCGELVDATADQAQKHLDELRLPLVPGS